MKPQKINARRLDDAQQNDSVRISIGSKRRRIEWNSKSSKPLGAKTERISQHSNNSSLISRASDGRRRMRRWGSNRSVGVEDSKPI